MEFLSAAAIISIVQRVREVVVMVVVVVVAPDMVSAAFQNPLCSQRNMEGITKGIKQPRLFSTAESAVSIWRGYGVRGSGGMNR